MSENNKALLSQKEIDTLVQFLIDQKKGLQTTVLTQESIDKLVQLLSNKDFDLLKFDIAGITEKTENETEEVLSNLVDYDCTLTYELQFEVHHNVITLSAIHTDSNTILPITPKSLELISIIDDDTNWGCCIDPILFDKIATVFHFKYKRATLEAVTRLFAEKIYGDSTYELPNIYRPSTLSVAQNLID
ncbi:hypothetical protein [Anaerosporobacter faecicola]|uniref:hypothetical protein n=1 Tax=Anaerosporobacter faecicola TaxID=2718714 RepID=UPI00143A8DEC|nr:hypothetical protein [Anaerosporobacter faecicola]